MEKPIICENTTVYDMTAHRRFNEMVMGRTQWIMYAVASLLGAAMIVLYFFMRAPIVLIFGITIVILINLMKFYFQPKSLKKTFAQILALRGEMVFAFRFHDDSFDELCHSSRGEQGVEIAYDALKRIIETKDEFLFLTRQNTAFYMRKDPDYEYETNQLSRHLSSFKNYRYRGKKQSLQDDIP